MRLNVLGFFSDVANFVKGGRVLGIDIGTVSVKVAELGLKHGRFFLSGYGILETHEYLLNPSRAIQTPALKLSLAYTGELLEVLLREMRVGSRTAVFGIPAFLTFSTTIDMPSLSREETDAAVRFEARRVIPLSPDEVSLDWVHMGDFADEKGTLRQRIFLVGIPYEIIRTFQSVCKRLRLSIAAFELETLALLRALLSADTRVAVFLDISAFGTTVLIAENGVVQESVFVDKGGLFITYALTRSLGLTLGRAEDLKRKRGLFSSREEGVDLSTLLFPAVDVIMEEAAHVIRKYTERYKKPVQTLIVSGGGANLPGLDVYASKRLGIPIFHPLLFYNIAYDSRLEPALRFLGNELSVAIGLAKGYFN